MDKYIIYDLTKSVEVVIYQDLLYDKISDREVNTKSNESQVAELYVKAL